MSEFSLLKIKTNKFSYVLLTKLAENDMIKEGEKEETMKLLHTADLHMDRSFEGLTGIPTALAKRLRKLINNC